MDLVKTGRQFGQARTPSLFTSLVNEQCNYCLNEVKMCLSDLRVTNPTVINIKEYIRYTSFNTPLPPLHNVQIGEVFL